MKTREILFRAKNKDGKWIFGMPTYNFDFIFDTNNVDSVDNYKIDKETLGQFTGLTDKKSIKIYEGDILKVGERLTCEIIYIEKNIEDYGDEIHSAFHAKIKQHNKIIPLDSYLKNNCYIIGNIYDNPELL